MSIAFRITLIIVSVFTLLYMCKKVKQEKLQIEYSIFWTLFAIMLVLFTYFSTDCRLDVRVGRRIFHN